jgi:predicted permease
VALATLALGIGANTAMFSIVNALLLRPFPFGERSERVVTLHSTHSTQAPDWQNSDLSWDDFRDLKAESRAFEDIAGYVGRNFTLADETNAERLRGGSVTPNLFPLLGIVPLMGRTFHADEAQPIGHESVALLSHGLWRRRFGGDPRIVGRDIRLNGRALTVVGVMPERFRFPERDDVWVPYRDEEGRRDRRYLNAIGVLREETSLEQAQQDSDAVAARLADRYPASNRGWGIKVLAFRDSTVDAPARVVSTTLLAAVGFVLLIGCANLANLLLARGAARRREMAVRTAVGASRGHLVREMLAESVLLAVAGGVLGLVLSGVALDLMVASWPEELPFWIHLEPDARVLCFAVGLSLLTALAVGLLPALRASRPDLVTDLRDGGHGGSAGPATRRLQMALAVGQVALCLALLVGANLMIRSFLALQAAKSGFDEEGLLTTRVYLAGDVYDPVESRAAFFRRAVEALRAVPGVREVAVTSSIPADDGGEPGAAVPEGTAVPPGEETGITVIAATPGLFDTLGARLIEGRTFTEAECADPSAHVAVVNQALARHFWPNDSPIGRRLGLVQNGATTWRTVVGVSPDIQYEEFGEETSQSRLNVFLPYARLGWRSMALLVRSASSAAAVAAGVRSTIRSLDAGIPTYDLRTMSEVRAYTTWEQRFFGRLMGVFALAALLLACLGVYGVLACAVSARTRELGVRMALGARPSDVASLVLKDGARLAVLGVLLGLGLAAGVGRVLGSILYGVSGADPLAFAGMAALLAAVALFASWLPARRASRVDPLTALRYE